MILRTTAIAALVISALLVFRPAAGAPHPTDTASAAEPAALYWQGHAALGDGDWVLALQRFSDLEQRLRRSEPTVADAAIYWQAYALARAGRLDETVAMVKRLRREFPRSRWNDDAARLLRSGGASAEVGGGEQATASLETLMSLPPARAIPRLVALLQDRQPQQLKKRALFVLSQIDDPGAVAQLVAVARSRDPELRAEAVRLLGVIGAKDEFREVYAAARDIASKRQALNAMGVAGADAALAEVARSDADPELRRSALQALGVSGRIDVLFRVARSHGDSAIRREAIQALGVAGGDRELLTLYPQVIRTPELRDAVLRSLLVAADERVVLVLYQRARTPELKRAVLRVLREAGHDPEATPEQPMQHKGSRE